MIRTCLLCNSSARPDRWPFGLDLVDGVEHNHAFGHLAAIVAIFPFASFAAEDSKRCGAHLFSSMICLRSLRMGGSGSRAICISPSGPLRMTRLKVAKVGSFSG